MIQLTDLSKRYGTKQALAPLSLTLADHSFTCLVGKSGCGKTTLLRLLAGLESKTTGEISGLPRRVAPVFQEPRLMPWLTVAQNIAFAAKGDTTLWDGTPPAGTSSKAVARHPKVAKLLDRLGLSGDENLYPAQLSGGMAQRVSLGRTLFYNPDLILMDEPFSALDYFTRQNLQRMLLRLFQTEQKTILFVTHDVEEALLLGDRILVMDNGGLKADRPIDLPRPRKATDPAFQALRQQILELLLADEALSI
ncbi:MAG: hypothetical protein ACFWT7_07180 [Succiniclasticum sp.]|jgi:sulfonate transport system ATP-binding protein